MKRIGLVVCAAVAMMPYRLDWTASSRPESFLFQVIPFSPEVKIYLDP